MFKLKQKGPLFLMKTKAIVQCQILFVLDYTVLE
jgi:hypothetical protein